MSTITATPTFTTAAEFNIGKKRVTTSLSTDCSLLNFLKEKRERVLADFQEKEERKRTSSKTVNKLVQM